ncbi:MAG: hypothetical protein R3185_06595 [Candidatus Thermoplasmatota archaeon]|nr:hypothetical protein [Candidatus Thermoplasmatota archaeon]
MRWKSWIVPTLALGFVALLAVPVLTLAIGSAGEPGPSSGSLLAGAAKVAPGVLAALGAWGMVGLGLWLGGRYGQ